MEKIEKNSIDDFLPTFSLGLFVIFLLVGLVKNIKTYRKLKSQDEKVRHLLSDFIIKEGRRFFFMYFIPFALSTIPALYSTAAGEKMRVALSVPICLLLCSVAFFCLSGWRDPAFKRSIDHSPSETKTQFMEILSKLKQMTPEISLTTAMFLVYPIIGLIILSTKIFWGANIFICICLTTIVVVSTTFLMYTFLRVTEFSEFLSNNDVDKTRSSEMTQSQFSKENLVKEEVSPKFECLFSPLKICLFLGLSSLIIFCIIVDADQVTTIIGFLFFSVMAFLTMFSKSSSDEVLECLLKNAAVRCQQSEGEEPTPHPSGTNENSTSSSGASATSSVEHQISGKGKRAASSTQSGIKENIAISID